MNKQIVVSTAILLCACSAGTINTLENKKIKPVPAVFRLANDPAFSSKQDTVLYEGVKFSGISYSLYPNADTQMIIPYYNGLQEGIEKKWFPGKQLAEAREYIDGKKEGIHKGWWQSGKPKFLFEVSDDMYIGEFKEWNSSGALIKLFHYKQGQEEGSQQLFYDNGKIRSNYVIIAGRRYGLLGTKNCVNVPDSIFNKR